MAKIPFNVKYRPQIESGEYKVVIEYGNRTFYARIVCWDFNSTELLACVNYGDREDALEYDSSGKHIGKSVGRPDLFIITPEPELSEFELKLLDWLSSDTCGEISMWKMKKCVKNRATELLDLARKELEPEVLERLEAAYKNQDEVVYENGKRDGKAEALKEIEQNPESSYAFKRGVEYGKEEALKDLPRWKKADRDCDAGTIDFAVFHKNDGGDHEDWLSVEVTNRLYKGEYYIELSDLEKLPKED